MLEMLGMADASQTVSEQLFEELCVEQRIDYTRLEECDDRQRPDYVIRVGGQRVVVEVKQIEPNEEDRRYAETLDKDGMASQTRNPDHMARRVRNHIKQSRSQFKSYLNDFLDTPAIMVLFDNARNGYTDLYTIQTAMHGFEHVVYEIGEAKHSVAVVDRGFAPRNNKEIRPNKNRHLSALATLHECWDIDAPHNRFLRLCMFHNQFADCPFNPAWWQGQYITHMVLEEKTQGQYRNWTRMLPPELSVGNCDGAGPEGGRAAREVD